MKALLAALLLLAPLAIAAQKPASKPAPKAAPKPASSAAPGFPLHLIEIPGETSVTLTQSANDGFHGLEFRLAGQLTRMAPKHPVVCVPRDRAGLLSSGTLQRIGGAPLDASRCFFRAEFVDANGVHTLLLLLGEAAASNPAPLLVIGFRPDGRPYKALELDALDVSAVEMQPTGARLIGRPTLPQVIGGEGVGPKPYALTYDPYAVYLLSAGGAATYSLEESQHYNEAHYVWAGPKSREDFAVLYNVPGHPKPFGAPANKVSALLHGGSKSK